MELSETAAGSASTARATRCSAGRRFGSAPRTRIKTDRAGLCVPRSATPRSSLTEPPLLACLLPEPTREKPSPRAKIRTIIAMPSWDPASIYDSRMGGRQDQRPLQDQLLRERSRSITSASCGPRLRVEVWQTTYSQEQ